ncbi:MAG: ribosome biogenesis GTP-binding protein YihA/YsxC [Chlamydiota bacterium]|nr:ribosome biogenesis GTP-binding protein YihA/YsxC [Chlamydiota bacterium]
MRERFGSIHLIASALASEEMPPPSQCPEVALIGRSNVGKSSLINHLFGKRKDIARVSSTPGKTQRIHFFSVDGKWLLVDLPGYGYAKVNRSIKREWQSSLGDYLYYRPLSLVILLMDSRRALGQEEEEILTWAAEKRQPLLPLFTKGDKLSQGERHRLMENHHPLFPGKSPLLYSIREGRCRDQLIATIMESHASL